MRARVYRSIGKLFLVFFPPLVDRCVRNGYLLCMTLTLAFRGLAADSPRQRARCSVSGRFVAWVKAVALRVAGAPRVVVVPSTVEPAADAAPPVVVAPVVAVAAAIAAPVVAVARAVVAPVVDVVSTIIARVGRWFRRGGCAV